MTAEMDVAQFIRSLSSSPLLFSVSLLSLSEGHVPKNPSNRRLPSGHPSLRRDGRNRRDSGAKKVRSATIFPVPRPTAV